MKNIVIILFIIILYSFNLYAQDFTQNLESKESVASVSMRVQGQPMGHSIINLNSKVPIVLDFDIFGEESRSLAYRIVYCDMNWNATNIAISNYLNGMLNEFYIEDFQYAFNTHYNYVHYQVAIPNKDLSFKISGNYLLEVYDENLPENVLFAHRFYVVDNLVKISGSVRDDNNSKYYKTNQIVNFTVTDEDNVIKYPRNITAVVSQNFRWQEGYLRQVKPLFVGHGQMQFTHRNRVLSFRGGYEFPYFSNEDLQQPDYTVHSLETDENGTVHCFLNPNNTGVQNYFRLKDMNGGYLYRAYGVDNSSVEGDYAVVHFSFVSKKLPYPVYVCGAFNQWKMDSQNLMIYDEKLGFYHAEILLKQGVYNYTYVGEASNGLVNLLGDFRETENDYYVLIYNKDETLRADKLVGFIRLNSLTDRK